MNCDHLNVNHSVIGSSNLGASVIGGINNNSGGALIRRGSAYTELSLYVWIDEHDEMHLINHLGIDWAKRPKRLLLICRTAILI